MILTTVAVPYVLSPDAVAFSKEYVPLNLVSPLAVIVIVTGSAVLYPSGVEVSLRTYTPAARPLNSTVLLSSVVEAVAITSVPLAA